MTSLSTLDFRLSKFRLSTFDSRLFYPHLPNRLIQHNAHGRCQVETSDRARHGNGEAAIGMLLQNPQGHPLGLAPEDQATVSPIGSLPKTPLGLGGEIEASCAIHG